MLPGPNLRLPKTSAGKALTEARLPKGGWDAPQCERSSRTVDGQGSAEKKALSSPLDEFLTPVGPKILPRGFQNLPLDHPITG